VSIAQALQVSATGLSAQRLRMEVIASNLANADSTTGPGQAFRRQTVVMTPAPAGGQEFSLRRPAALSGSGSRTDLAGVAVTGIVADQSPLRRVYRPGDPLADAEGYVTKPNVDTVTEMVDMVAATRAYQANVTAMGAAKQMFQDTLRIARA
jgi:flagellar basal-body rod protein FlgC